jgi:hypothetical protein
VTEIVYRPMVPLAKRTERTSRIMVVTDWARPLLFFDIRNSSMLRRLAKL